MAITTTQSLRLSGSVKTGGDWTIPIWQVSSIVARNFTEYRSRSAVPKFREKIRMGVDATGPYMCSWVRVVNSSPCNVEVLFRHPKGGGPLVICSAYITASGPYAYSGFFTGLPDSPSTVSYAKARNAALKYLYNRNSEVAHAFQGGVFAGELRETWNLIKNPFRGLKQGLWGYLDDVQNKLARNRGFLLRLSKKRRTKWINDAIADSWLAFTLGFMPLVHDIEGALRALGNLSDKSETYGLTATGTADDLLSQNVYSQTVNQIPAIIVERSVSKCSVRMKCGIRLSPPQVGANSSVQNQLSLTMTDFIPTIWNLIPGSFLYDYVTNIGDVLDAYANPIVGQVYAVESSKTTQTMDISAQVDTTKTKSLFGSSFVAVGGDAGAATAESGRFERRIVTNSLIPSFEISLDLGDRQALNVAALLQKGNLVKLLSLGLIK